MNSSILKKFIASCLVISMTFGNIALVSKTYATTLSTFFGGNDSKQVGNDSVEFDVYFEDGDVQSLYATKDVNAYDTNLNLKVNVNDVGYLKDATIEFLPNSGKDINFEVSSTRKEYENSTNEEENVENVQKNIKETEITEEYRNIIDTIEDNKITLKQITTSSDVNLSIPLEYKNEKYIKDDKLDNSAIVRLSGVYVDKKGNEFIIARDYTINLKWTSKREIKSKLDITKYIDFGSGIILQGVVKVNNEVTEDIKNYLPVKSTNISIKVPNYMDKEASNVSVSVNKLEATNGQNAEDINFGDDDWNYNPDTKDLYISVQNEKQSIIYKEDENAIVDEENKIEEERIYNIPGEDEYVITFTYLDVHAPEEGVVLENSIKVEQEYYTGSEAGSTSDAKIEGNLELKEQSGNLVSLEGIEETEKISKAFGYLNYLNENKIEKEIVSNDLINISNKDIIESIKIKDSEIKYVFGENEEKTNDVYYKRIILSRKNINDILGEDGNIEIYDLNGTIIEAINKETLDDEDKIEVNLEGHRVVEIRISRPIKDGNLIIKKVRAIKESSISKERYKEVSAIKFYEDLSAKYQFVANEVKVNNINYGVILENTSTKADLKVDKESLATLTNNENVTFTIELNNDKEESDIYGKSHFEIEFPKYIVGAQIKDTNLSSAAGLEIENIVYEENKIKIDLKGMQDEANVGSLSNGTNIIINADVEVDDYAPAIGDTIGLSVQNEQATNYGENNEYAVIQYSAPTGLVTVNDISGYRENAFVTSIRQGKKDDLISIYSEKKRATMGINIMNNNQNEVSNIKILGRFPFEGVKDLITGDDMKVTFTCEPVSLITPDQNNKQEFKVYYSPNGDATDDLNVEDNEWIESPEHIEDMESYMILPLDENYRMQPGETLRFSYDFEIPEGLSREQYTTGTFIVEYVNHLEIGDVKEKSCPDIVGLTTGVGPEIDFDITCDQIEIYNDKEFIVNAIVDNVGRESVKNIKIKVSNFANVMYMDFESSQENSVKVESINEEAVVFSIDNLDIRKELELKLKFKSSQYSNNGDAKNIQIKAELEADDLGTIISKQIENIEIKDESISIREEIINSKSNNEYCYADDEIEVQTVVMDCLEKPINDVVITKTFSDDFEFVSAKLEVLNSKTLKTEEIGEVSFNQDKNEVTGKLDKIENRQIYHLKVVLKTKAISSNYDYVIGIVNAKVEADSVDTYIANPLEIKIAKVVLDIQQLTETKNEYINVGDIIEYKFLIKNIGQVDANTVIFKDEIPDGLEVEEAVYTIDGNNYLNAVVVQGTARLQSVLGVGQEMIINIDARAKPTGGTLEKTVINKGSIEGNKIEKESSKSVLHIIRPSDEDLIEVETSNIGKVKREFLADDIANTNNKISGRVWIDSNNNGMIDNDEKSNDDIKNITVDLVNIESGEIQKSVKAGDLGEYRFSGIANGRYAIVFEYDSTKYGITTYKKAGASEESNSDAYPGKLNKNGTSLNVAMTDEIELNNSDVNYINLGLINAEKFDLEVSMGIAKITIQNEKGTKTNNYNNEKFAKEEIPAKVVNGSKVIIEYNITVANVGEIEGYVKKLVDYVPEGMEFNSSYSGNNNWYTLNDGKVYSNSLESTELKPGEKKNLTLVLTKNMTDDNTGQISNQVEIFEDYNIYGISDVDSTPGNNIQKEDDHAIADVLILIKTGEEFIYASVIVSTIAMFIIIGIIVYNRHLYNLRKKRGY